MNCTIPSMGSVLSAALFVYPQSALLCVRRCRPEWVGCRVLSQVQEGQERVVAYASRSLHPAERNDQNYRSIKLELLGLKWAITEKFKDYL